MKNTELVYSTDKAVKTSRPSSNRWQRAIKTVFRLSSKSFLYESEKRALEHAEKILGYRKVRGFKKLGDVMSALSG